MVIAINTRILSGDIAAAKLLFHHFKNIAAANPDHQFCFITNDDTLPALSSTNVKNIILKQQSANPLLWKLWYNYKLPSLLKKIKADVLVSADGICSLRSNVPQCLLVNDVDFLYHPEWYSSRYVSFIKKNMPVFLQKAKSIVTFSNAVKYEIISKFAIDEKKITVASYNSNKKYQSLTWNEREKIKEKYTEGNEYFLFYGAIHNRNNLTNLLKAFSLFKKRQKSSMQLILLTDNIPLKNEFINSLRLYKYRDEIKLIDGLTEDEIIAVAASAWCAINLSPLYSDIKFIQNTLLFEVPVITGNSAQAKELLADAALYANPLVVDTIAAQMMLVYKDENKRNELVQKGKELCNNNAAKENAGKLWHNLLHLQP
jgi:glycosyltransferase involved in cell wall biosynthesis